MVVAPSITWLLVRTSPEEVSTMPVPAASSCWKLSVVLMSTSPGSTFEAMAETSDGAPVPDPGVLGCCCWGTTGRVGAMLEAGLEVELHNPWPMATPAASSRTAASRRLKVRAAEFPPVGGVARGGAHPWLVAAHPACQYPGASPAGGGGR